MDGTWNCEPSVSHTGGTFQFPENNTTEDIVYIITYTGNDGCVSTTKHTVHGKDCPTITITKDRNIDCNGGDVKFTAT